MVPIHRIRLLVKIKTISFLPVFKSSISFSCPIVLATTASTMVKRSGECGLVAFLIIGGKILIVDHEVWYLLQVYADDLYQVKINFFFFILSPGVLVMNLWWNLNYFSVSIEIIISCFSPFYWKCDKSHWLFFNVRLILHFCNQSNLVVTC